MNVLPYLLLFLSSLVFSSLFTPFIIRLCKRFGVVDKTYEDSDSGRKRMHANPIPRMGGVAIFLAATISFWLFSPAHETFYFIGCAAFVFLVGFLDDVISLSALLRLVCEVLASLILIHYLQLYPQNISLFPNVNFDIPLAVGYAMGVLILVGAINSINMIDGLDGLAGGVIFISLILLSFIHFLSVGRYTVFFLTLPLIGALIGFLRYNSFPAKIFLGDGGSYWLGFICGTLFLSALSGRGFVKIANVIELKGQFPPVSIASLILCLGIPIFDTSYVIMRRLTLRQNPMAADNRHFHHTLLRLGLNQSQSVGLIYFISLIVGICGISPIAYPSQVSELVPYYGCVGLFLLIIVMSMYPDNAFQKIADKIFKENDKLKSRRLIRITSRLLENANLFLLYIILLGVPLFAKKVPPIIGYSAACGAALLVSTKLWHFKRNDFLSNAILYIGCAILLVANNINPVTLTATDVQYQIQGLYNLSFLILFFSTLTYVLINLRKKYFLVSPSSFLLMAIPLLFLIVPDPLRTEYKLNIISLRCLVLFFAIHILCKDRMSSFYRLRFVCIISLIFISFSGIYGIRI